MVLLVVLQLTRLLVVFVERRFYLVAMCAELLDVIVYLSVGLSILTSRASVYAKRTF